MNTLQDTLVTQLSVYSMEASTVSLSKRLSFDIFDLFLHSDIAVEWEFERVIVSY